MDSGLEGFVAKTVRTALRPEQTIGYCVVCNELVHRTKDAGCPQGHAANFVHGLSELPADGAIPKLPRFNLAAFLMPPVWGVGHGSWVGALVLPLWLFTDSAFQAAYFQGGDYGARTTFTLWLFPTLMALVTFALMLWYGFRGWGLAWRRKFEGGEQGVTFEQFLKSEQRWIWVSLPMLLAAVALGVYFWVAVLIPHGGIAPGK